MFRRAMLLLCLALPGSVLGEEKTVADVADFSGDTIRWVIPFRVGGGSDSWARFLAPFLSRYLPGNPEVQVINEPGGGSTRAANRYALNAAPDGLTLLGTSASTQFPYLLEDPRVRYDYRNWRVLLVSQTGGVVYTSPEVFGDQEHSVASLVKQGRQRLVYGSQGPTSLDLVPLLSFEILGVNVRPIFGIRGRSAGRIAFERGDATLDFQTSAAYLKNVVPMVEAGRAVPLFALGVVDEAGQLVRDPAFPDLPTLAEVYENLHGRPPSGVKWESWSVFHAAAFGAQKFIVLPVETPETIVRAYNQAFVRMQSDPEYLANKNQVIGAYDQFVGEQANALYIRSTRVPSAAKVWVINWLNSSYGLKL